MDARSTSVQDTSDQASLGNPGGSTSRQRQSLQAQLGGVHKFTLPAACPQRDELNQLRTFIYMPPPMTLADGTVFCGGDGQSQTMAVENVLPWLADKTTAEKPNPNSDMVFNAIGKAWYEHCAIVGISRPTGVSGDAINVLSKAENIGMVTKIGDCLNKGTKKLGISQQAVDKNKQDAMKKRRYEVPVMTTTSLVVINAKTNLLKPKLQTKAGVGIGKVIVTNEFDAWAVTKTIVVGDFEQAGLSMPRNTEQWAAATAGNSELMKWKTVLEAAKKFSHNVIKTGPEIQAEKTKRLADLQRQQRVLETQERCSALADTSGIASAIVRVKAQIAKIEKQINDRSIATGGPMVTGYETESCNVEYGIKSFQLVALSVSLYCLACEDFTLPWDDVVTIAVESFASVVGVIRSTGVKKFMERMVGSVQYFKPELAWVEAMFASLIEQKEFISANLTTNPRVWTKERLCKCMDMIAFDECTDPLSIGTLARVRRSPVFTLAGADMKTSLARVISVHESEERIIRFARTQITIHSKKPRSSLTSDEARLLDECTAAMESCSQASTLAHKAMTGRLNLCVTNTKKVTTDMIIDLMVKKRTGITVGPPTTAGPAKSGAKLGPMGGIGNPTPFVDKSKFCDFVKATGMSEKDKGDWNQTMDRLKSTHLMKLASAEEVSGFVAKQWPQFPAGRKVLVEGAIFDWMKATPGSAISMIPVW